MHSCIYKDIFLQHLTNNFVISENTKQQQDTQAFDKSPKISLDIFVVTLVA